jgi:hypothetical protein
MKIKTFQAQVLQAKNFVKGFCKDIKIWVFPFLLMIASVTLAFSQGLATSGGQPRPYDAKSPPPLPLVEAYGVAMSYVGSATNQLWCVSASCLDIGTNSNYMTHWTFGFSNTNSQITPVIVFFNKTVGHMVGAELRRNGLR